MSYTREREQFIVRMVQEGVRYDAACTLLRCATSINRYAELACSSEAADRDRIPCPADPKYNRTNDARKFGPCLCDLYQSGRTYRHPTVPPAGLARRATRDQGGTRRLEDHHRRGSPRVHPSGYPAELRRAQRRPRPSQSGRNRRPSAYSGDKIADLDVEPFKAYYHTTCVPDRAGAYVYTCSDPVCAVHSGEVRTTIQPHTFPSCTWCGKLLQVQAWIKRAR